MAYMTEDGQGPYPNKVGEYCGNHYPKGPPLEVLGPLEAKTELENFLKNKRFGRPRATRMLTMEKLREMGMVGLYLKEDSPLNDDETQVDTPPELREPEPEVGTTKINFI